MPMVEDLAIVATIAVAVTVLLSRLKFPAIAGLLAAGALMGPFGFRLAKSVSAIEVLAEVGVVLLLFSIGLEFSLARLATIFRAAALGGALQVGLTIAATTTVAMAFGRSLREGIFYGFVFALSSTAVVLRALSERRELDAPHGRFIVATLIFQDLCVVPMVLMVPLLGAVGDLGDASLAMAAALAKAAIVVVGIFVLSRFAVPKVLDLVEASKSREIFLLAILGLCIGTAWITSLAGLSLALGAFLGGVVVADTEYGHRAMGDILPLRDAFVSIFFVSLGMLFDVRVVADQPLLVGGLLVAFIVGKGLLATFSALMMRFPARAAWLAGVGLAQFGEFGFVLIRIGQQHGLGTQFDVAPLLAAGIGSMFLTPLLARAAPHITAGERLLAPLERRIGVAGIDDVDEHEKGLEAHVVVVGFGLAGRAVTRTLIACELPVVVLELNAENVRRGKAEGLPVYYGDATSVEALRHARIAQARLVVLLMNDFQAMGRVVDTVRREAPKVPLLVRTHFLEDRPRLYQAGAKEVVAEEVEGAIEIIFRSLRMLGLPRNVIEGQIRAVRTETGPSQRTTTMPRRRMAEVTALGEMKVESALVQEGSRAVGASAVSLALRSTTGALMVGLRRGARLLDRPDPTVPFEAGDIVFLAGTREEVARALPLFTVELLEDDRAQHEE